MFAGRRREEHTQCGHYPNLPTWLEAHAAPAALINLVKYINYFTSPPFSSPLPFPSSFSSLLPLSVSLLHCFLPKCCFSRSYTIPLSESLRLKVRTWANQGWAGATAENEKLVSEGPEMGEVKLGH